MPTSIVFMLKIKLQKARLDHQKPKGTTVLSSAIFKID